MVESGDADDDGNLVISMVMIDDNDVDNKFDDGESKVKVMVAMKVLIEIEVMIMMMMVVVVVAQVCVKTSVQLNVYLTREGYCKTAAQ